MASRWPCTSSCSPDPRAGESPPPPRVPAPEPQMPTPLFRPISQSSNRIKTQAAPRYPTPQPEALSALDLRPRRSRFGDELESKSLGWELSPVAFHPQLASLFQSQGLWLPSFFRRLNPLREGAVRLCLGQVKERAERLRVPREGRKVGSRNNFLPGHCHGRGCKQQDSGKPGET